MSKNLSTEIPQKSEDNDLGSPASNKLARIVGFIAAVLALISASASFVILMGLTSIVPDQNIYQLATVINGSLVAVLISAIGWELVGLWLARRRGKVAARLHVRVIRLFALVAGIPAIIVAIIAGITLDQGLDRFFSIRTQEIVNTSRTVAQAYMQESSRGLVNDAISILAFVERANITTESDIARLGSFINRQSELRKLNLALILDEEGRIVTPKQGSNFNMRSIPNKGVLESIEENEVVVLTRGFSNEAGVIANFKNPVGNRYLYITRALNPEVLRFLILVEERESEFRQLARDRSDAQLVFSILFAGMALVVLLSAIWLGISFANRLVSPIRRLMTAAGRISEGDLDVVVPWTKREGDLGVLSQSFNEMTGQLRSQRKDLILAKDQIDERRRFNEAMLEGVPAGVIGIEQDGTISLVNRSVLSILGLKEDALVEKNILTAIPELSDAVSNATTGQKPYYQDQITITRKGEERVLNVRITMEQSDEKLHRFVVTLDEITNLIAAQRRSAWADVARRIAHEIKNPLTPIQLSAERLQRRYGRKLNEDREVFDQCTQTIIRQVEDIGRMVDAFSSFARMPQPTMEESDLTEAIKEAVFLQEVANSEISFEFDRPDEPLIGFFDARLISQAVTNVVKNATESIGAIPDNAERTGKVEIMVTKSNDFFEVVVADNGIGLPQKDRSKLLEPYMTTREKGTGLGLAIVRKIFEEHGGTIELLDGKQFDPERVHGAVVKMTMRVEPEVEGKRVLELAGLS